MSPPKFGIRVERVKRVIQTHIFLFFSSLSLDALLYGSAVKNTAKSAFVTQLHSRIESSIAFMDYCVIKPNEHVSLTEQIIRCLFQLFYL